MERASSLLWVFAVSPLELPEVSAQPGGDGGTLVIEVDGPDVTIDGGQTIMMDDGPPMGLADVGAVFPFAGPFAPQADGTPGDRFLHESLGDVDRTFLSQLMPVLQAKWPTSQHPCQADVTKLCPHDDVPLHCLGTNAAKLSAPCRTEIRHTVPFVCSDEVSALCDGLEQGIIPCLESHGKQLNPDCADSIVAAKHALTSMATAQQRAKENMLPKAQKKELDKQKAKEQAKHTPPPGAVSCPRGWQGPRDKGCCTRRWATDCEAQCALNSCNANKWEFQWIDFRYNPYTCCPPVKNPSSKYIGGQTMCPKDWSVEKAAPSDEKDFTKSGRGGHCCRRGWSWGCGTYCAKQQCSNMGGFDWYDVNTQREQYRCCVSGMAGLPATSGGSGGSGGSGLAREASKSATSAGAKASVDDMPDGLGESWVGKPVQLDDASRMTKGLLVIGGALTVLVLRRWLFGKSNLEAKRH